MKKKVIRLNEQDVENLVKKIIKETSLKPKYKGALLIESRIIFLRCKLVIKILGQPGRKVIIKLFEFFENFPRAFGQDKSQ